jgi:hypothetical protein
MKNTLIILLLITSTLSAQNKIKLNIEYFNTQPSDFNDEINVDSINNIYEWYFNDSLISSGETVELKTNYPQFDKLVLVNKVKPDTTIVYSILKSNESFGVLCDIKFDYISLLGNNSNKYPSDVKDLDISVYDSLFRKIEYGTIQFAGKNIPKKTNMIGTYGYNIGTSTGVKIENTKTNFQLLPFSAGMNPGTTKQVIIGKYEEIDSEVSDSLYQKYETVYYLLNSNETVWEQRKTIMLKEIKYKFYIRLFDNENVIIEYDYKTNKYKINKG